MSNHQWYLNTDQVVWIRGLTDPVQNQAVNDATITAQMQDEDGENVGNVITFTYDEGSDGDYYGIIPYDLPLVEWKAYTLVISIQAATLRLELHLVGKAVRRRV